MATGLDFQRLFDASPNAYILLSPTLTILEANEAYLRVTQRTRDELLGRHVFDAFPESPADAGGSGSEIRASLDRALRTGKPDTLPVFRYAIPRAGDPAGSFEERFWSTTNVPVLDEHGAVAFILHHTVDVTELQRLKHALRAAEVQRDATAGVRAQLSVLQGAQAVQEVNRSLQAEQAHLRRLFDQAPGFIACLSGPDHVFELANRAYYHVVGERDLLGKSAREALPEVAAQGFLELLDQVRATGEAVIGRETLIRLQRTPEGPLTDVYADFIYQPVFEADGSVSGIFVQGSDVTQQKLANDELRGYREQLEDLVVQRTHALEESEARLRHSQRLETVGRLTGGVAHDFNNLLQVIGGNLQLLERDLGGDEKLAERLRMAQGAVQRGARLAEQLLAFARRQPLEPVTVDLARLLPEFAELARRALETTVAVSVHCEPALWNAALDRHQLESALLNLAFNASDAMEGSGTLRIEAANAELTAEDLAKYPDVAPGEYVRLRVSDSGAGMSPEVLEHAVEPFFTTKPAGRGTGLGLSQVYGFAKQSDGHIEIDSEVGKGTCVTLYFPRAIGAVDPEPALSIVPGLAGGETVFVVEDDPQVRATVAALLREAGYEVLEAPDAEAACRKIEAGCSFDLLLTDVIMPGPVSVTELARLARERRPGAAVLYTSGYPQDAIVHRGRIDPGVDLLRKPYTRDVLVHRIRQALAKRDLDADPGALRVLLVEDDEHIRAAVEELLAELGHHVCGVESAEAALTALAREPFDLLFSDISLPGVSGLELARQARALVPGMAVVLASGYSRDVLASEKGLDDVVFLQKPYDLEAVESMTAAIAAGRLASGAG
jgi:signal transduction histidine kinase/DNA-binding response OmpR family regulator